ncbi:A/G-specific adenine glycosylase [Hoeflea sp. CAU 1731]
MKHTTKAHAATLLDWYDRHHRSLPWRVSPQDRLRGEQPDPYRIWLSEIMLQQTTVQAVKPYFTDFLKRWPTIFGLAAASEQDVLKAWAGLGYYSRARNLKKCADMIVRDHGGRFPQTIEALKKLPGIGDYTAAAIAAIAFDSHATVVDGNIERVISRLSAIDTPLPAGKTEIKAIVHHMTPKERPGDFAQALMDLGATLCTPKRPACALCPFNSHCEALATSDPELHPVKPAKKAKPVRRGAAFVAIDRNGAILLRRRPDSGLLAGMSEVPTTDWTARRDGDTGTQAAPFSADWRSKGSIKHIFTHFELRLDVYRADVAASVPLESTWWSPPGEIDGEALPTVMKKAIAAAIS